MNELHDLYRKQHKLEDALFGAQYELSLAQEALRRLVPDKFKEVLVGADVTDLNGWGCWRHEVARKIVEMTEPQERPACPLCLDDSWKFWGGVQRHIEGASDLQPEYHCQVAKAVFEDKRKEIEKNAFRSATAKKAARPRKGKATE